MIAALVFYNWWVLVSIVELEKEEHLRFRNWKLWLDLSFYTQRAKWIILANACFQMENVWTHGSEKTIFQEKVREFTWGEHWMQGPEIFEI